MSAIYQIGFDCHIIAVFTDRDKRDRVLYTLKRGASGENRKRYWWQDVAMDEVWVNQIKTATAEATTDDADGCEHEWAPSHDGSVCRKCRTSDRDSDSSTGLGAR